MSGTIVVEVIPIPDPADDDVGGMRIGRRISTRRSSTWAGHINSVHLRFICTRGLLAHAQMRFLQDQHATPTYGECKARGRAKCVLVRFHLEFRDSIEITRDRLSYMSIVWHPKYCRREQDKLLHWVIWVCCKLICHKLSAQRKLCCEYPHILIKKQISLVISYSLCMIGRSYCESAIRDPCKLAGWSN